MLRIEEILVAYKVGKISIDEAIVLLANKIDFSKN